MEDGFDWGALGGQLITGVTQVALAKEAGSSRRPPAPQPYQPFGSMFGTTQARDASGQPMRNAYGQPMPETAGQKLAAIAASPYTWLAIAGTVLLVFGVRKLIR